MREITWKYVAFAACLGTLGCGGAAPAAPPAKSAPAAADDEPAPADGGEAPSSTEMRQDVAGPDTVANPPQKETSPTEPLPEGTKVLHVGDSFAGALGRPLSTLFEEAGMRSVLKHTDASYLTDWAWDGNLQKYIWKYNPDLIIVTLGANELEITEPDRREKTVKKIIDTIGEVPCVWVAIPLWDGPKNGLLDVIEEHSHPCVFMDTNDLLDPESMPRIHDGIHPTTAARKKWAEDVLLWLRKQRKPTEERPWNLR